MKNVLSLFDGISGGQIALNRVGIKYDNYYASEIDKYAIQVTQKNYPNTIQLSDIKNWKDWNIDFSKIDLLLAGFPCQAWSVAGKQKGIDDPRGELVFILLDVLNEIKKFNSDVKFLFENVRMKKDFIVFLNNLFGVDCIEINSSKLSAQNRKRLYWSNIPNITMPEDKGILLKDIIHENCLADRNKSHAIISSIGRTTKREYFKKNQEQMVYEVTGVLKEYIVPFDKTLQILDKEVQRGKVGYFRKDSQANRVYYIHGKAVTLCGESGGGAAKMGQYLFGCITPDRINKGQNGQRFSEGNKFYTLTTQERHGILIEGYIRKLTPVECLKGDTLMLGVNKKIKDVNVGDKVLSQGGFQKVLHKFENNIDSYIYKIKAQGSLVLDITEDHPVLVCEKISKKNRKVELSKPKWEKVKNLKEKKHYIVYPIIKGFLNITSINLNDYVKDTFLNHKQLRKSRNLPTVLMLDSSFSWLMGLCTAKASVNKLNVEICLSKHETYLIDNTIKILKSKGFSCLKQTKNNVTKIVVLSVVFNRFLEQNIGKLAHNKKIPDFILYNNNLELLKSFLKGYFDGDGYERITESKSHNKSCITVSELLAYQVQIGLLRLGFFSSIYSYKPKSDIILGRKCKVKRKYIVSYVVENKYNVRYKKIDNHIIAPIQKIIKEKFKGKVYNIETEDNTYLASNYIVHNCERLQTIPDNYTEGISNTQRYKMLGNGWTVDVISHIFKFLKGDKDVSSR